MVRGRWAAQDVIIHFVTCVELLGIININAVRKIKLGGCKNRKGIMGVVGVAIVVAMDVKIIVLAVVISVAGTVEIVACPTAVVKFSSIAKKDLIWVVVCGTSAAFLCEYYWLCSS